MHNNTQLIVLMDLHYFLSKIQRDYILDCFCYFVRYFRYLPYGGYWDIFRFSYRFWNELCLLIIYSFMSCYFFLRKFFNIWSPLTNLSTIVYNRYSVKFQDRYLYLLEVEYQIQVFSLRLLNMELFRYHYFRYFLLLSGISNLLLKIIILYSSSIVINFIDIVSNKIRWWINIAWVRIRRIR